MVSGRARVLAVYETWCFKIMCPKLGDLLALDVYQYVVYLFRFEPV